MARYLMLLFCCAASGYLSCSVSSGDRLTGMKPETGPTVTLFRDSIQDNIGSTTILQCAVDPGNYAQYGYRLRMISSDSSIAVFSEETGKVTIRQTGYAEIIAQLYDEHDSAIAADTCKVYAMWNKAYTVNGSTITDCDARLLTCLPSGGIIYAALSCSNPGLVASQDGGISWMPVSNGIDMTSDTRLSGVSVDPANHSHLILVTTRNDAGSSQIINVWESKDAANSWTKKAIPIGSIYQVVFPTQNGSTVFVASMKDSLNLFEYNLQNGVVDTLGTVGRGAGILTNPMDSNRIYSQYAYSVDRGRTWSAAVIKGNDFNSFDHDLGFMHIDAKGREYAINRGWDGTPRSRIFRREFADSAWAIIYEEGVDNALSPWSITSAIDTKGNSVLAILGDRDVVVSCDDGHSWTGYEAVPPQIPLCYGAQCAIVGTSPLRLVIALQFSIYQWFRPVP